MIPDINLLSELKQAQKQSPQKQLKKMLAEYLPKRVIEVFLSEALYEKPLQHISHADFENIAHVFSHGK